MVNLTSEEHDENRFGSAIRDHRSTYLRFYFSLSAVPSAVYSGTCGKRVFHSRCSVAEAGGVGPTAANDKQSQPLILQVGTHKGTCSSRDENCSGHLARFRIRNGILIGLARVFLLAESEKIHSLQEGAHLEKISISSARGLEVKTQPARMNVCARFGLRPTFTSATTTSFGTVIVPSRIRRRWTLQLPTA